MKNTDYLIDPDEVANLIHHNVESGFSHTTYREELERFAYLENGDDRAVESSVKLMNADVQGRLSEDPLRNYKYLFIVNTGLATRVVIEAGVTQELVYSISDVYIRKADEATTIDEVKELNREIWKRFVRLVRDIRKRGSYSKPVQECINYITSHFNTKITLNDLAGATGLTPNYLASVFKRDTGMTVGEYLFEFQDRFCKSAPYKNGLLLSSDSTVSGLLHAELFHSGLQGADGDHSQRIQAQVRG